VPILEDLQAVCAEAELARQRAIRQRAKAREAKAKARRVLDQARHALAQARARRDARSAA
jgi:ElaB/YqjD/DUF883 family membrane-anchored ribosome-binding protein